MFSAGKTNPLFDYQNLDNPNSLLAEQLPTNTANPEPASAPVSTQYSYFETPAPVPVPVPAQRSQITPQSWLERLRTSVETARGIFTSVVTLRNKSYPVWDIITAERCIGQMFSELSFGDVLRTGQRLGNPPSRILNRFLLGFNGRLPTAGEVSELLECFRKNPIRNELSPLLARFVFKAWTFICAIPTQETVDYIVNRIVNIQSMFGRKIRVLEVGAGNGRLGLAIRRELARLGVEVEFIMTDLVGSRRGENTVLEFSADEAVRNFRPDVVLSVFADPIGGETASDVLALRELQRIGRGYFISYHNGNCFSGTVSGSRRFLKMVADSPVIKVIACLDESSHGISGIKRRLFTISDMYGLTKPAVVTYAILESPPVSPPTSESAPPPEAVPSSPPETPPAPLAAEPPPVPSETPPVPTSAAVPPSTVLPIVPERYARGVEPPQSFRVSETNVDLNPRTTSGGFLGGTIFGALLLMAGPVMIREYEEHVLPRVSDNRRRSNGLEQFVLGNIPLVAYMGGSMLITGSGLLAEIFGAGFGMVAAYPVIEGVDISAEMIGLDTSINSPGSFVTTRVLGAALMYASSYVPIAGRSAAGFSHAAITALRAGSYGLFSSNAVSAVWRGGLTGLAVGASAVSGTIIGRQVDHLLMGDVEGCLEENEYLIDAVSELFELDFSEFGGKLRIMGRRVTEEDSDGGQTLSGWYANWAYDCIHGHEHSSYAEHRGV